MFKNAQKDQRGEIDCLRFRGFERSRKRLNSDDSFIVRCPVKLSRTLGGFTCSGGFPKGGFNPTNLCLDVQYRIKIFLEPDEDMQRCRESVPCEGQTGAWWCLQCSGPWKPDRPKRRALYLMFKLQMPEELQMRGWQLQGMAIACLI